MLAQEVTEEAYMQGSNLYSISEKVLLKWMQYHYNKMNPLLAKRVTNFDADFQDVRVFDVLIRRHYENIKNLKDIKTSCYNDDHRLFKAKSIIEVIHEIGLNIHIVPQNISLPSAREMLLLFSYIRVCLTIY